MMSSMTSSMMMTEDLYDEEDETSGTSCTAVTGGVVCRSWMDIPLIHEFPRARQPLYCLKTNISKLN